jgi:hypothetical protein
MRKHTATGSIHTLDEALPFVKPSSHTTSHTPPRTNNDAPEENHDRAPFMGGTHYPPPRRARENVQPTHVSVAQEQTLLPHLPGAAGGAYVEERHWLKAALTNG